MQKCLKYVGCAFWVVFRWLDHSELSSESATKVSTVHQKNVWIILLWFGVRLLCLLGAKGFVTWGLRGTWQKRNNAVAKDILVGVRCREFKTHLVLISSTWCSVLLGKIKENSLWNVLLIYMSLKVKDVIIVCISKSPFVSFVNSCYTAFGIISKIHTYIQLKFNQFSKASC